MDSWVSLNLILPLQILGRLHPAPSSCHWMHRSSGCSRRLPKPHLEQLLPSFPSFPPSLSPFQQRSVRLDPRSASGKINLLPWLGSR